MEKRKFLVSDETVSTLIGIVICLFSIYLSLNLANVGKYDFLIYLSRAITWVFAFLFGSVYTYLVYFFMFLVGIYFIFRKRHVFNQKLTLYIIGTILFCIGGMIIVANGMSTTNVDGVVTELSFSNFGDVLYENVIKTKPNLVINFASNGGLIGMLLAASLNAAFTSVGTYTIGTLLFVSGIVVLLINPGIAIYKTINEYKNFNVKYDPKGQFTKARDITLTTTTINSIDDEDIVDINARKINQEPPKEITKSDVIKKLNEEQELSNNTRTLRTSETQMLDGDHFEDKPLTRARFDDYVSVDKYDEEDEDESIFAAHEEPVISDDPFVDTPVKKESVVIENRAINKVDTINTTTINKVKPKRKRYVAPSTNLLETRTSLESDQKNIEASDERKEVINTVLTDLGIKARVISYRIGPSVTRFDIKTDKNESIRGFDNYVNDICIRLGGVNARFTPIVQGKTSSGLEIANVVSSMVNFKDCVAALNRLSKSKPTSIPFGKDINNELLTVDLAETPHLLVSGTTGSGKSIFVHSLLMTLIMRNTPDQLKLVLIDPKTVEFSKYREIPHLMCPPIGIDDPNKPYDVLVKLTEMMDERYRLFSETDCSKLSEYNEYCKQVGKDPLPVIVVVVDEYADLVDANKKMSEPVVRIGQKARAAGIHMIIATQRPSVNVINGVIKANIPSRVALLSSSYTDSNTIVDQGGAEKLIGNGDMLIKCALLSNNSLLRCQGAFVSKSEIKAVTDYLRSNYAPEYDQEIMDVLNKPIPEDPTLSIQTKESRFGSEEEIYQEVKKFVMSEDYISMSKIQNTFSVGFNRARRFFERLQNEGVISADPATNSAKGSKVLIHNFDLNIKKTENNGSLEHSSFSKREN